MVCDSHDSSAIRDGFLPHHELDRLLCLTANCIEVANTVAAKGINWIEHTRVHFIWSYVWLGNVIIHDICGHLASSIS